MFKRYLERLCGSRSVRSHYDMVVRDMRITQGGSHPFVYWMLMS
ncbi:MAG: hypothetical protein Q4C13_05225 [Clostridia bacterium]|nr:hypothetical protein [Clostridia bacterium]